VKWDVGTDPSVGHPMGGMTQLALKSIVSSKIRVALVY
jgi:hypothetical protein